MNKIKTFEDACKAVGVDAKALEAAHGLLPAKYRQPLLDHAKLVIIAEALNEGWQPNWDDEDEEKRYPWFDMERGFSLHCVAYNYSNSYVSSRLCFKNRDLAQYAYDTFPELYKSYFTYQPTA